MCRTSDQSHPFRKSFNILSTKGSGHLLKFAGIKCLSRPLNDLLVMFLSAPEIGLRPFRFIRTNLNNANSTSQPFLLPYIESVEDAPAFDFTEKHERDKTSNGNELKGSPAAPTSKRLTRLWRQQRNATAAGVWRDNYRSNSAGVCSNRKTCWSVDCRGLCPRTLDSRINY